MPRTYADTVDAIEQLLQDTGNATFTAAEINYEIEQVFREIVMVSPHILEVSFSSERGWFGV